MKVDIITVGDEIVSGKILDLNSKYLATKLNVLGYEVRKTVSIGDDENLIVETLKESYDNSDIVFICGGLGPTVDDITRESVAKSLDKELKFDEDIYAVIKSMFDKRGLKMATSNKKQAFTIEGGKVLPNKCGTAPGIYIKKENVCVYVLPGPPKELVSMFESDVENNLVLNHSYNFSKTFKVVGIGESSLEEMVYNIISEYDVNYGIYANGNLVDIVISCFNKDGKTIIESISEKFESVLGYNLYSNDKSLIDCVCDMLISNRLSISFAESCTGGMISSTLVGHPNISSVFNGSYVTYSNSMKETVLKVNSKTLEEHGAVSKEVVKEMAKGLSRIAKSDISLSVSGIAGPGGGSDLKPVGTVWTCIYFKDVYYTKKFFVYGDRNRVRSNATNLCFFEIFKLLKEIDNGL